MRTAESLHNMFKLIKTIIAPVIALALFIAMPFAIHAETVHTEGTLNYTVDNGSVTITGWFGRAAKVEIPAQIAGMPINTVAAGAFRDKTGTTVVLPDSVAAVEQGAFDDNDTVVYAEGSAQEAPESGNTVYDPPVDNQDNTMQNTDEAEVDFGETENVAVSAGKPDGIEKKDNPVPELTDAAKGNTVTEVSEPKADETVGKSFIKWIAAAFVAALAGVLIILFILRRSKRNHAG